MSSQRPTALWLHVILHVSQAPIELSRYALTPPRNMRISYVGWARLARRLREGAAHCAARVPVKQFARTFALLLRITTRNNQRLNAVWLHVIRITGVLGSGQIIIYV